MGIKLEIVQERGWKRLDPSDPLFCIKFRDSKTEKLLFTYAPKWEDVPLWLELIKALILYEDYKSQKRRRETCKCKLSSTCMEESKTSLQAENAE